LGHTPYAIHQVTRVSGTNVLPRLSAIAYCFAADPLLCSPVGHFDCCLKRETVCVEEIEDALSCSQLCQASTGESTCNTSSYEPVARKCCFDNAAVSNISTYTEAAAHMSAHRLLGSKAHGIAQACGVVGDHSEGNHGGHHSVFQLGGHLEYSNVCLTMAMIIVFTIYCEQCLAKGKRWTEYFSPLL
jgi:hypothetical protein